MKTVVSVSLGQAKSDFDMQVVLGEVPFRLRRLGTGGDLSKARRLVEHLDGRVDAIGLGGANLSYRVGPHSYECGDGRYVAAASRRTPVVDGSGFKDTYERRVPAYLEANGIRLKDEKVLLVSALDRWALGEAFEEAGAHVMVGDAVFALGLPVVFAGLKSFSVAARLTMWGLCRLPLRTFYPLGAAQERGSPRFEWVWREAGVVAGDFHFIRRYLPRSLQGKVIVTTSTTAEDRRLLKERGATAVCTMSLPVEGRSLAANVFDACAVAALGRFPLESHEYVEWWQRAGLRPHMEWS